MHRTDFCVLCTTCFLITSAMNIVQCTMCFITTTMCTVQCTICPRCVKVLSDHLKGAMPFIHRVHCKTAKKQCTIHQEVAMLVSCLSWTKKVCQCQSFSAEIRFLRPLSCLECYTLHCKCSSNSKIHPTFPNEIF